jgi:Dicarboxylate transport
MGLINDNGRGRWPLYALGVLFLVVVSVVLLRIPLTAALVGVGLKRAGAGEVKFELGGATPWLVEIDNLSFRVKAQSFEARRVIFEREKWWKPTLGRVRIEGARVPVTVDESDANPWAWPSYAGQESGGGGGLTVPLEQIAIDGQLIVQISSGEQPIELKFEARPEADLWNVSLHATGPGLSLDATGKYVLADHSLAFRADRVTLELKPWESVIQKLVPLPGGAMGMEGNLTASAEGTWRSGKAAANGQVHLRSGRFEYSPKAFTADGVEADFIFTDFVHLQSQPGAVRAHELRVGNFSAGDFSAGLTFQGLSHLTVTHAKLDALGGTVSAEPFELALGRNELETVVTIDGIDVEKVLALTPDIPAKASGRIDGHLPIRIDESGLRLGTGWLELKKGVYAEVQFKASGLLTTGMKPGSTTYAVMQKVEAGLLRMKLGQVRLDVRPPDAPRGHSARLHLEAEPVDASIRAPVTLDWNVSGPIEQLLNFGLNQRMTLGGTP